MAGPENTATALGPVRAAFRDMTIFFRRFIGALVLDAGTFEDIEHDRGAAAAT
jgi:hypothetical protein